jgi:hypothetical protein
MLNFYAVPPGWPNAAPMPPGAPTRVDTEINVAILQVPALAAPLAAVVNLGITKFDIAGSLWSDSRFALLPITCFGICESLYSIAPQVSGNFLLAGLTTHYRRIMSEISGCATGLAVAKNYGFVFSLSRSECDAIFGVAFWTAHWPGNGPDYLLINPFNFSVCFYETKGHWGLVSRNPPNFLKYKVQSLNANCPLLVRHILSYSHLSPGQPVSVQWFNHAAQEPENAYDISLVLLAALHQFIRQLSRSGHVHLADYFAAAGPHTMQVLTPLIVQSFNLFERRTWVSNINREPHLAIDNVSFYIFSRISNRNWYNNDQESRKLLRSLRRLAARHQERRVLGNMNAVYRSATGVSLLLDDA